jgi:hypothetical protein
MRYCLYVKNGLEWEIEEVVFNSIDGGIRYANNRFPQNEWKVTDRTGRSHASSSALQNLQADAYEHLQRFQRVEESRQYFESLRVERSNRRETIMPIAQDNFYQQPVREYPVFNWWDQYPTTDEFAMFENDQKDAISEVCWWKEGF